MEIITAGCFAVTPYQLGVACPATPSGLRHRVSLWRGLDHYPLWANCHGVAHRDPLTCRSADDPRVLQYTRQGNGIGLERNIWKTHMLLSSLITAICRITSRFHFSSSIIHPLYSFTIVKETPTYCPERSWNFCIEILLFSWIVLYIHVY